MLFIMSLLLFESFSGHCCLPEKQDQKSKTVMSRKARQEKLMRHVNQIYCLVKNLNYYHSIISDVASSCISVFNLFMQDVLWQYSSTIHVLLSCCANINFQTFKRKFVYFYKESKSLKYSHDIKNCYNHIMSQLYWIYIQ